MKTRFVNDPVAHALKAARRSWSPPMERSWLKASIDSQGDRVWFLALEGSPPKAYVLVLHDVAIAFDMDGQVVGRFTGSLPLQPGPEVAA